MSRAVRIERSEPAEPSAPHLGLLVAEATAIQMVASMAVIAMPAMAPLVAASLGLKESLVGLQVSLLYLAATLASLVAGGLVRRLGGCRTGQLAMLLVAAGLGIEALGWRSVLAGLAVAALVLAVLSQGQRRSLDADRDRRARVGASPLEGLRAVWRSASLRAIALAAFCFAGLQVTVMTFLVAYLSSEVGIGLVAAGVVLAAAQGGALCGRMAWGWVADRLKAPLAVLGLLGGTMMVACLLLASLRAGWGDAAFLLVAILTGASAVGWNGVFLAEVARLATAGTIGVATGGAMVVTFMGVLVAPSAFAGLYEVLGSYRTAFLLLGLLGAAGGLLAFFALRRAAAAAR